MKEKKKKVNRKTVVFEIEAGVFCVSSQQQNVANNVIIINLLVNVGTKILRKKLQRKHLQNVIKFFVVVGLVDGIKNE